MRNQIINFILLTLVGSILMGSSNGPKNFKPHTLYKLEGYILLGYANEDIFIPQKIDTTSKILSAYYEQFFKNFESKQKSIDVQNEFDSVELVITAKYGKSYQLDSPIWSGVDTGFILIPVKLFVKFREIDNRLTEDKCFYFNTKKFELHTRSGKIEEVRAYPYFPQHFREELNRNFIINGYDSITLMNEPQWE